MAARISLSAKAEELAGLRSPVGREFPANAVPGSQPMGKLGAQHVWWAPDRGRVARGTAADGAIPASSFSSGLPEVELLRPAMRLLALALKRSGGWGLRTPPRTPKEGYAE